MSFLWGLYALRKCHSTSEKKPSDRKNAVSCIESCAQLRKCRDMAGRLVRATTKTTTSDCIDWVTNNRTGQIIVHASPSTSLTERRIGGGLSREVFHDERLRASA